MGKVAWKAQIDIDAEAFKKASEAKINELKAACTKAIFDGFKSEATGYSFGFNELDQTNFTQQTLLIVSKGGPANYTEPIKWKTKSDSVVELTPEQFIAITEEAKAHKIAEQEKFWTLEVQVLSCSTVEEINAISW